MSDKTDQVHNDKAYNKNALTAAYLMGAIDVIGDLVSVLAESGLVVEGTPNGDAILDKAMSMVKIIESKAEEL